MEMTNNKEDEAFLDAEDSTLEIESKAEKLEQKNWKLINLIGSLSNKEEEGISPEIESHRRRIKEAIRELEQKEGTKRADLLVKDREIEMEMVT